MVGMQHLAVAGVRWLLAIGMCALLGIGVAGTASAHAELRSSNPADGASLDMAPEVIRLVFGEVLLSGGAAVTATNSDTDKRLDLPTPQLSGRKLTVSWPESAPGGQYRVAFRVVSADGHPITGSIQFRYRQARSTSRESSTAAASPPAVEKDSANRSHSADPLGPTEPNGPISPPILAAALAVGVVSLFGMGFGLWHTTRRRY